jgi:hypothetical protein
MVRRRDLGVRVLEDGGMTLAWLLLTITVGMTLWIALGYGVAIVLIYGIEAILRRIFFKERR